MLLVSGVVNPPERKWSVAVVLISVFLLLVGCAGNRLPDVHIESAEDSNQSSALTVDLIVVSDASLKQRVMALTAPEWFAQKNQLMMAYGDQLKVHSTQVPPLMILRSIDLPYEYRDTASLLLFANYISATGQRPAVLDSFDSVMIRLERNQYRLSEAGNH